MNVTEFKNKREELGIDGTGVECVTKKEMTWTSKSTGEKVIIPVGTSVHVDFSPKKLPSRIFVTFGDKVLRALTGNGHQWLTKFSKPPTIITLERRACDGVSKSVLGERVEPDGYGPTGAPSWELVVGVI
jgi:hypothetical protein